MTKEDKPIVDRGIKENWRIGDRTRLKRLLEKNLKLYRDNEELKQINSETLAQLNLDNMELIIENAKLKKENAELKSELPKKADTNHSLVEQMAKLEEENASMRARLNAINLLTPELEKCSKLKKQRLSKAKEIIKELKDDLSMYSGNYQSIILKAEQFLKEIEK